VLRRILPVAAVAALAFPAGAAARHFHGTVVKRHGHSFVVADCSAASHQMARLRSAHRAPRTGARVAVSAHRRHGLWVARSIHRHGRRHGGCEVEGTITAIDPSARTLTIAADDHGDDTALTLTVTVPESFDLGQFTVGDEIEVDVVARADGTLVLSDVDDHGDDHGDDGPNHDQGDDHGDDGAGGGGDDD
jgi:Cu/Ag efflux protein CusF